MSRFKNIWIFLFLTLSSVWGANMCTSTTEINMNADSQIAMTYDAGTINKNTTKNYYMKIGGLKKGTLTIEPSGNNIQVSANLTSCPSTPSSSNAIVLYIDDDRDLNIKLRNSSSNSNSAANIKFTFTTEAKQGYRPFEARYTGSVRGDMKMIGNTILVPPTGSTNTNYCSTYTNGTYIEATSGNQNYFLCGYSVDGNKDVVATQATLDIPDGAVVVWAGLYWQSIVQNNNIPSPWTNMPVKIKKDGGSYSSVTVDNVDYKQYRSGDTGHTSYSAFSDVTSIFKNSKWAKGSYVVSGIPTYEGKISSLGTYGAWSLVVVYELDDEDTDYRSVTVFDGWTEISSTYTSVDITTDGFYTPNKSGISSKLAVFTAEGDRYIGGDRFYTYDYTKTDPFSNQVPLGSSTTNAFDSSITGVPARTPNLSNNNGIDIHNYEIGQYLKPKQTDMKFSFRSAADGSGQDTFWPSVLAFSTDMYVPPVCYDYSFKQDGVYISSSEISDTHPLTISGAVSSSDIEVSIYLRSQDGDFDIEGLSLYTDDLNSSLFSYVPNSAEASQINGTGLSSLGADVTGRNCRYDDDPDSGGQSCFNGTNVRIGLGRGASGYGMNSAGSMKINEFVYAKFLLKPKFSSITDVSERLKLGLNSYIVTEGGTPIPNNLPLGRVAMCPPSHGSYEPLWGMFNVVDRNALNDVAPSEATSKKLPYNNLKTQVVRKPFNVDIAVYGKDSMGQYKITPVNEPDDPIKTTVLVEMIDNESFHDINTSSCGNPDANISAPIVVGIEAHKNAYRIQVPSQDRDYFNYAVKNGTFRIWFFEHNGTVINWSATTSAGKTTADSIASINNLYKVDEHGYCASNCSNPTSPDCFKCIKSQYAKPICARDNFSIRPESYDLRIYDVNQTSDSIYKDLSSAYNYTPTSGGATDRINIAAGYEYRYDMNSTGNDSLDHTPGYTRYFTQIDGGYYARMKWDSAKTLSECNDIDDKAMEFYVSSGKMTNQRDSKAQVGDYKLEIYDKDWTAVDWNRDYMAHHTAAKGFEIVSGQIKQDCIENDDTTNSNNALKQIGCITKSEHIADGFNYKDHKIRLKPSYFDMSGIVFYGGIDLGTTISSGSNNNFVYYSNIDKDEEVDMSIKAIGEVRASSFKNEALSNFTTGCYATDLGLEFSFNGDAYRQESNGTRTVLANNRFWNDTNATSSTKIANTDSGKYGLARGSSALYKDVSFTKDNAGSSYVRSHINIDKDYKIESAPKIIIYNDMNITCDDCNMEATENSLPIESSSDRLPIPNIAIGSKLMDFNATHVYGRIATPQPSREMADRAFEKNAAYEVYLPGHRAQFDTYNADGSFNAVEVAQEIPAGFIYSDSVNKFKENRFGGNWYVNELHSEDNHGDANVTQISITDVTYYSGASINAKVSKEPYNNDGKIEYKFSGISATPSSVSGHRAHIATYGWLWYYKDIAEPYADPVTTKGSLEQVVFHPTFEFRLGGIIGDTGSAKEESEDDKANKQSAKKSTWKSTSEYAPSVK